jgi:peptide deformylase
MSCRNKVRSGTDPRDAVDTVPRACSVGVAYLDEQGEPQFVEASGWYARTLRDEIDPLREALYKTLDAVTGHFTNSTFQANP